VLVACADDEVQPVRLVRLTGFDRAALESLFRAQGGPRIELARRLSCPVDAGRRRLLAVADPTGDLPHSRAEGSMLDALFESESSLLGKRATKQRVLDALSRAGPLDYLHFACHGRFRWRHPEASGLLMAGGEVLHLSEILGRIRLGSDTLVVLSACETGIAEYRELPDETYGLALAFLGAGASAVICSLWPVSDRSTRLLMLKLYEYLHAGASAQCR
jgi:CHAT domain-containing protein